MLCGFTLFISGCGGEPPKTESPAPAPTVVDANSASSSSAPKSSSSHRSASNGGANDSGGKSGDKAIDPLAKSGDKPADAAAQAGQIGDEEAKTLFAEFDKALATGNAEGIRAAMFYQATIEKALRELDLPNAVKVGYFRGIMESFAGANGMPAHLAGRITNGEKYHLVRTRKIHGSPTVLYRHFDTKNRMGYSEFIVGPDAEGKAKILDIHEFGGDEYQSDQLRRSVISEAAKRNPEYAKTLTEEQRQWAKHENEIGEIDRNFEEEHYAEVIAGFEKLPEVLRKSRQMLGYRVGAVRKKKDLCDDLVKLFREKYPGDRGLDLVMPAYLAAGDRWDEAIAAVDVFDRDLGGDTYLDAERANYQLQKGNFALAKTLIANAAKVEPDDKLVKEVQKQVENFDKDLAGGSASDGPPAPPAKGAEAKEFVAEFLKVVAAGDGEAIGKCFDAASFYRRASVGIDVPHRMRLGIEAAFRSNEIMHFTNVFKIGRDEFDRGGSFSLLRLHSRGDDHCAMFRQIFPGGGFRYFDAVLVHDADGKVRIGDYMELEIGMMASKFRAYVLAEDVRINKAQLDDDAKTAVGDRPEQVDPKTLAGVVVKMREMVGVNREQDALALYDRLTTEWQQEQAVMVTRVLAARGVKGAVYEKALRDYHKAFPDALNFNLLAIDFFRDAKQYDREIACARAINVELAALIGTEDPYLDVICADACWSKKDFAGAKRDARKAIDADPTLHRGYRILLLLSLSQKKYNETSQLLTAFCKQFPSATPNVETDPEYAGFAKSTAGKLWINQQKRKT
jgi:hypothetical protein